MGFSQTGQLKFVWSKVRGSGPNQLSGPEQIALDAKGNLYVEDWGNHRVVQLSPRGDEVRTFGSRGIAAGQIANSAGIAVGADGDLYVADMVLHRIQVLSPGGALLRMIPAEGKASSFRQGPSGLTVDDQRNIYVPDGDSILKLSGYGEALARWK